MENVMGTAVFLLTEFRVEPSNNHSGSAVGRSINFSLFSIANVLSIKQCDDPESNKATNGRAFLVMAAEVRERRKELGVMEVEFSHMTSAALPFFGQLFKSTVLEKLPISFPSLTLLLWAFVGLPPIHSIGQSCAECPSFPHMAQRLPLYCWTHLSYLSHALGVQFGACVVFGGGCWAVGWYAVV